MRRLLALALLVLPAVLPAQQDPDALVAKTSRLFRASTGFQAEFRQRIEDPRVESSESRGTLYQSGDRFAMRFTDPKGGAFVLDGRFAWVYTPDESPEQVLRIPVQSTDRYELNPIAFLLDRPAEKFRTTYLREEPVDGRMADVVALDPLVGTMGFRRATLWIDRESGLPRRFAIDEKLYVRHITLSRIRTNGTIPRSVFTFTPPPGVRVIDQEL
ncbi:MAG: outer membrane lipoprotein carrier protein LolA [Gemmatimonadetes bacterium]|nr:outer membrane lipoprotein carrier protein LolA [Gemmatimonadota bacterium]MCB9518616.1 outer membrane lipoprotein carrier protein LolA [Gemmatimonadales bacterium]MCA9762703.1 outer membrane lipoprotein carrier protein LolA [Gemmatimonadota bacterium]MCA9767579.1 outer membrane lipoprotein carrier protein LolA [Gemmatimonadota bacterium]HPF62104.1 outer-membrane lipoprotein carrier protein LolA [Gemmatimonadales bacterium]